MQMNLEVMARYMQFEREYQLRDAPRKAAEQQALKALRQRESKPRSRRAFFRLVLAR